MVLSLYWESVCLKEDLCIETSPCLWLTYLRICMAYVVTCVILIIRMWSHLRFACGIVCLYVFLRRIWSQIRYFLPRKHTVSKALGKFWGMYFDTVYTDFSYITCYQHTTPPTAKIRQNKLYIMIKTFSPWKCRYACVLLTNLTIRSVHCATSIICGCHLHGIYVCDMYLFVYTHF